MTTKLFDFKTQLQVGDIGETLVFHKYPILLYKLDANFADYIDEEGRIYELKTDTYPLSTGNFFIERWSDTERQKPGGVWQALQNQVDIWLYLYLYDKVLYQIDDIPGFVTYLETHILPTLKPIRVHNRGYYGTGYKVSRESVRSFVKELRLD